VTGLGKGRVGHEMGTGGNWARTGHGHGHGQELGTHWAWARAGTGHALGTSTIMGGTGHGLGMGTGWA
jgi:hypothetical protein